MMYYTRYISRSCIGYVFRLLKPTAHEEAQRCWVRKLHLIDGEAGLNALGKGLRRGPGGDGPVAVSSSH